MLILGNPFLSKSSLHFVIFNPLILSSNLEDIITAYPNLTRTSINAVLAYASDVVSNETVIAAA